MDKKTSDSNIINMNLSDDTRSFQDRIDEVRSLVEENLRYTKSIRQNPADAGSSSPDELKTLLQENLEISKELREMVKKINHWMAVQRILGVFKILIIIVPLALGIIYLPSLLKGVIGPYQELLNLGNGAGDIDTGDIIKQITEQLK